MRRRLPHWHHHPGVRSGSDLSLGERAADRMRNGMGSWAFVFAALGFLAVWMSTDGASADRFPFILLNLVLSCLAAMQGAILLIAAKRSDQVASEQAVHHYRETQEVDQLVRDVHTLLQQNTQLTEQIAQLIEAQKN